MHLTGFTKIGLAAVLMALAGMNAVAAPVTACSSATTLQDLINVGTCQYGDKLFSNFLFDFSGSTSNGVASAPLVPATSTVDVAFSNPGGDDIFGNPINPTLTFTFTTNNTVTPYQGLNLIIQYQVDVSPDWVAEITGMAGGATGAYTTGQTVGGVTLTPASHPLGFEKDACIGGPFDEGNAPYPTPIPSIGCGGYDSGTVLATNSFTYPGANTSLSTTTSVGPGTFTFPGSDQPATEVGVYDVFVLSGGTATKVVNGKKVVTGSAIQTAKVVSFYNTIDEKDFGRVPEPTTLLLVGAGALVLGIRMRRREKS